MTAQIKNHTAVQQKALTHTVTSVSDIVYRVVSGASGETYYVRLMNQGNSCLECTCPRQKYIGTLKNGGQNLCSHVQAVIKHVLAEEGYAMTSRPSHLPVKNLHRRVLRDGSGDNVVITARKDVNPDRQLRKVIVDDRPYSERLEAIVRANAWLLDMTPEEAVLADAQMGEVEYA